DNFLSGGGFSSGEVLVVHTEPAGVIDDFEVDADATGTFSGWRFRPRVTTSSGAYTLTVTGTSSALQAQAVLEISSVGGFSLSPGSAPAGSFPKVTLDAEGFTPGELVDFDGPFDNFTQRADASGAVHVSVSTNVPGTGRLTAHVTG